MCLGEQKNIWNFIYVYVFPLLRFETFIYFISSLRDFWSNLQANWITKLSDKNVFIKQFLLLLKCSGNAFIIYFYYEYALYVLVPCQFWCQSVLLPLSNWRKEIIFIHSTNWIFETHFFYPVLYFSYTGVCMSTKQLLLSVSVSSPVSQAIIYAVIVAIFLTSKFLKKLKKSKKKKNSFLFLIVM